jgi:hypothetical protein
MEKNNNNLAYISIIAVVAVVGMIGLIMTMGGGSTTKQASTPANLDFSLGGENLAGDARALSPSLSVSKPTSCLSNVLSDYVIRSANVYISNDVYNSAVFEGQKVGISPSHITGVGTTAGGELGVIQHSHKTFRMYVDCAHNEVPLGGGYSLSGVLNNPIYSVEFAGLMNVAGSNNGYQVIVSDIPENTGGIKGGTVHVVCAKLSTAQSC